MQGSFNFSKEVMILMYACELWDDRKAYEEIRERREEGVLKHVTSAYRKGTSMKCPMVDDQISFEQNNA